MVTKIIDKKVGEIQIGRFAHCAQIIGIYLEQQGITVYYDNEPMMDQEWPLMIYAEGENDTNKPYWATRYLNTIHFEDEPIKYWTTEKI